MAEFGSVKTLNHDRVNRSLSLLLRPILAFQKDVCFPQRYDFLKDVYFPPRYDFKTLKLSTQGDLLLFLREN